MVRNPTTLLSVILGCAITASPTVSVAHASLLFSSARERVPLHPELATDLQKRAPRTMHTTRFLLDA